MKRAVLPDACAVLLICAAALALLGTLVFPHLTVIATPDFGTNDAVYRSLATKFEYGRLLRNGTIPLWTTLINSGYPVLPDAVGVFYPVNLVLFTLFDAVTAYNLSIIASVILFGSGFYWWLRGMGIGRSVSLYAGVTLMLSGIIIPRLTHGMVIPSLSLLPWILGSVLRYAERPSAGTTMLVALFTATQFLANFPQASVITVGFAAIYFLFTVRRSPDIFRRTVLFALLIVVAAGIAAVQLIPSWEYLSLSSRQGGFGPEGAVQYSYHPKNFLTFLDPFAIGTPKNGTYPPYWVLYGSIFWENSGYAGLIPIVLAAAGIPLLLMSRKRETGRHAFGFFLASAAGAALLMLGKFSPLYIIFTVPPLSLFRTPSRFLWIAVPSLVIAGAITAETVLRRPGTTRFARASLYVLFILNGFMLYAVWRGYHLYTDTADLLRPPEILAHVTGKTYSVGIPALHNDEFIPRGWTQPDVFRFLKNGLQPNGNVFYGVPSADVYGAVPLTRSSALTGYLLQSLAADKNRTATVSATAQRILNISAIQTIITPYTVEAAGLTATGEATGSGSVIRAYRNNAALPRVRMVYDTVRVRTFEDAFRHLSSASFDPSRTALTERDMPASVHSGRAPDIDVREYDNGGLDLRITDNPSAGLLVVADTYYPGWTATLDGRSTDIEPVNISQRGIRVPSGTHTVSMRYTPRSIAAGTAISTVSMLVLIALAGFHGRVSGIRSAVRDRQRRSRRDNSPEA